MTTYSYDRENRLISQNVDGNVTSFAYDGFGRKRRESRGVNPDVILNWDGDQMIVESSDLDPEAPSKAFYVADGVIYAENANLGSEKSRRDYAVDFLGSVTGLTDSDASLSSVRRWSAYGKLLSGSAEPIGYFWTGNTGSRVYQSLGLNDNRARHYGRNIKQWITRDPLWPSELPYAYVGGNPVTSIDPSGLWTPVKPKPDKGCPNGTLVIRPEAGDTIEIGVSSGGGYASQQDCITMARKRNPGANCICINGGFFGGGGPIGPVTTPYPCSKKDGSNTIPGVATPGKNPVLIPVKCPGNGGSVCGRPIHDPAFEPAKRKPRTAACVDQNGVINFLIAIPKPPGATAEQLEKCMRSMGCLGPVFKPVLLDGGGSTQVVTSSGQVLIPSTDEGGNRDVHNWIIVCEK